LLLGLALLLAWAPGLLASEASIEGRWEVVEYDQFFPENPFFGQYRYDLLISRDGDRIVLEAPRSGMRLAAKAVDAGRLIAEGEDPNRGRIRLDVAFEQDRFEGRIETGGRSKRIAAILAAEERLGRISSNTSATVQQLRDLEQAATDLRQQRDDLAAQLVALEDALAASRAAQRVAEHEVALARQEAAELKALAPATGRPATPVPVPRPGTAAADTDPQATSAAGDGEVIEIIEPPLGPSESRTTAHDLPVTEVIGRAKGGARLLTVRVNGQPARLEGRGLFRASVTVAAPATPVCVVIIDVDGRRLERRFDLVAAAGAPTGDNAASGGPDARCYELGVAAAPPSEAGVEACRQAVRVNPARALNHYHLGVALSRMGRHAEALTAYREAAARWSR